MSKFKLKKPSRRLTEESLLITSVKTNIGNLGLKAGKEQRGKTIMNVHKLVESRQIEKA